MDAETTTLAPTAELAHNNPIRIPNESAEYRAARRALLAEEIELRRYIERVAAPLPPGGKVMGDYRFQGEWPQRFRRALRRQADPRHLQICVRTGSTAQRAPRSLWGRETRQPPLRVRLPAEAYRGWVKVVAGKRNQRYLQALNSRIPMFNRPLTAVTGVQIP